MKTAGMSTGTHLGCLCSGLLSKCRVRRLDVVGDLGALQCRDEEASVLTTPGPLIKIQSSAWGKSSTFITILREPVSRVWSYFVFQRPFSPRYRQRPLAHWLHQINLSLTEPHGAPGLLAEAHRNDLQLSNNIARTLGAETRQVHDLKLTSTTFSRALDNLECFSVVGFVDELDVFTEELKDIWICRFSLKANHVTKYFKLHCPFPHENSAEVPNAMLTLDDQTLDLIRTVNQLDLRLYVTARSRANLRNRPQEGDGLF